MFTQKFDGYICEGDSIEYTEGDWTYTARIVHDSHTAIDDDDCYNTDQSVSGCNDEQFTKLMEAREAYFRGEWRYYGVVISVEYNGVTLDNNAASLWGIEGNYPGSDNSYFTNIANELLEEAKESAESTLAELRA